MTSKWIDTTLRGLFFFGMVTALGGPGVQPVEAAASPFLFVDASATGANDGTSWADAYVDLQDALAQSASGDEIWVAEGLYDPSPGTSVDRQRTFQLVDGVEVYGGFRGMEHRRQERDPDPISNRTVLSGDLLGDDAWSGNADNSYHIVDASGTSSSAILDGFTVTGGNADGSSGLAPDDRGGGIYCELGSPTLRNLLITGNQAQFVGGGMYNTGGPILSGVSFDSNVAVWGGGLDTRGAPTLTHVTFRSNVSLTYAGGMYVNHGSAALSDVSFQDNVTGRYGGGMALAFGTSATLIRVEFLRNSAAGWTDASGGGLVVWTNGTATLTDATFSGNSAVFGGGIYDKGTATVTNAAFSGNSASNGGALNVAGAATVTNATFAGNQGTSSTAAGGVFNGGTLTSSNVILWGNVPNQLVTTRTASSSLGYSLVEGGCPIRAGCSGTLVVLDPRFQRDPSPGPDGSWDGVADDYGDLGIGANSPATDAGDNTALPGGILTDLGGQPRFKEALHIPDTGNGSPPLVDLGAFENQISY